MENRFSSKWVDATIVVMPVLGFAGCALLLGLRAIIAGKAVYSHLVWNLFLAMVPYAVVAAGSLAAGRFGTDRGRALALVPVALLWLVFYPNAPYIFTDFIHVLNRTFLRSPASDWLGLSALIWYDILMNAAFAFIGHFIGLVSLWMMRDRARAAWGSVTSTVLALAAIILSGFGIYLGRFSRLNSWDIVTDPRRVVAEIAEATSDPKALLFSAAFSAFILLSYASLAAFKAMPSGRRVD
ncbi:MAG: DUF1361 domain-containing protein [Spirochaetaceae bacterium]|nr:DUF1361 domain-containing protein [Spirochaetaceae bacterium]